MSTNEMEARLGVAIGRLESAKLLLLPLFNQTYPHMVDEKERLEWARSLMMADEYARQVREQIEAVRKAPMLKPRAS